MCLIVYSLIIMISYKNKSEFHKYKGTLSDKKSINIIFIGSYLYLQFYLHRENNPFAPQQALPQTLIPTKFVRQQSVVLIPRPQPQQQPPQPEPQTIPNQSMEEPQQNEEPNGLLNFIIQHIIAQNLQREAQLTEEKPPRVDAEPNYGFMFRPNQRVNPEISDNKMNMEEDSAPQMNRWPQMNRGMGVLIAVPSQNGNDRMPEGMNVPQPEVPKAPCKYS